MKQQILNTIKSLLGTMEYRLRPWKYKPTELVVLCMHSTPAERRAQFEKLLDFLLRHFRPLQPGQLNDYFQGKLSEGPYVLFTFDDGLKNNLLAAELIEKRGAKAVFFVVPNFVDAVEGRNYYLKNIRSVIDQRVDHEPEDFEPMNISDLKNLLERGHFVESHTLSHLLRNSSTIQEIENEIAGSKRWLSERLNNKATMFCSPIQSNYSVNSTSKKRIQQEYVYHFTTFPGLNGALLNPQLIYRRNIEVFWSMGRIKYSLGKADLARWKADVERFQQL
ncbi:MAG: polysaccharide deacetylase family protein [Flavobacteriales bacterium]